LIDDDVLGVAGVARLRRTEKAEQRAFRSQQAGELIGERLCGGAIEIVEDIPAEDAIDWIRQRRKPGLQKTWNRRNVTGSQVPVEVGKNILDSNLAPELLPEEADVGSDDRSEIEQDRRFPRRQAGQEFAQRLGREHNLVGRRDGDRRVGFGLSGCDAV
jgi:hypothetical protein